MNRIPENGFSFPRVPFNWRHLASHLISTDSHRQSLNPLSYTSRQDFWVCCFPMTSASLNLGQALGLQGWCLAWLLIWTDFWRCQELAWSYYCYSAIGPFLLETQGSSVVNWVQCYCLTPWIAFLSILSSWESSRVCWSKVWSSSPAHPDCGLLSFSLRSLRTGDCQTDWIDSISRGPIASLYRLICSWVSCVRHWTRWCGIDRKGKFDC